MDVVYTVGGVAADEDGLQGYEVFKTVEDKDF